MTKEIKLTRGKVAIVDDHWFDRLNKYKWYCESKGYARRNDKGKPVYMHRVVAKTPPSLLTDHINRIKLDNREENLRNVTCKKNSRNLSPYKLKPSTEINLASWRESAGHTQESLAIEMKISVRTITRWEAAKKIKEVYMPVLISILGPLKNV